MHTLTEIQRLRGSVEAIRALNLQKPKVALILGSGLGGFADGLLNSRSIPASELPGYPASTVEGHAGKLVFGTARFNGKTSPPLLVFKGRVHFYETGSLERTVAPVLLAHALGIRTLVITNAAGGINRAFSPGDLMLIRDVLSIQPAGFGPIPPRTTTRPLEAFDPGLTALMKKAGLKEGVNLREGTYFWLKGPSYETAAEIRMLGILGADAVGMSTVPEVLEARNLGMRIVGVSLISNMATGVTDGKLSHDEVTEAGRLAAGRFTKLLTSFLVSLK